MYIRDEYFSQVCYLVFERTPLLIILTRMMDALRRVKLKTLLHESPTKIKLHWKQVKCVECENYCVLGNMKIILRACFPVAL